MPAAPFPCPAQVRWTALSMTSYADKRRDVRLNTKEARKRLESGQEMLQGLLNKDLDLLKEVLLAKGEGAAGGSGSGAAARHASISKLVQKKVRGGGRMYMLCGRLQSGACSSRLCASGNHAYVLLSRAQAVHVCVSELAAATSLSIPYLPTPPCGRWRKWQTRPTPRSASSRRQPSSSPATHRPPPQASWRPFRQWQPLPRGGAASRCHPGSWASILQEGQAEPRTPGWGTAAVARGPRSQRLCWRP